MRRQWSVNGRFLGRSLTGVDRYALEILRAMDVLIGEGHPLADGITLNLLCPAGATKLFHSPTFPYGFCQVHRATCGSSLSFHATRVAAC